MTGGRRKLNDKELNNSYSAKYCKSDEMKQDEGVHRMIILKWNLEK
jgi:hypothetical protein